MMLYQIYYHVQPKDTKILYIRKADRYAYHIPTNTIFVDNERASIISALHELGHALHGRSELDACAYSIKLFARVFPQQYHKLTWEGHMLKLR